MKLSAGSGVRLPIDAYLPEARTLLAAAGSLLVEAAPGAGKTTRLPAALADTGRVLVLEPRRLAARLAAVRVARELGTAPGDRAGYQVRFDRVASDRTQVLYITEGVLPRLLASDPDLRHYATVVLDEFHERHLETDAALAILASLRERRPDLRLVVMSATLEAAPVAAFLNAAVLSVPGRQYPLDIAYTPVSADPLEERVAAAAARLTAQGLDGDILVFLPGAAEIRRAARALEPLARRVGCDVLPLHGDLSPEDQDRAIEPGLRWKIILSTNVAESSITIEGVTAVIDSGLARIAADSPRTGLPRLEVTRISQASANQRAGRAGRTGPGRAIRLYPLEDFVRRPEHDTPEILRRDLAPLLLDLHGLGFAGSAGLRWLTTPPEEAVAAAGALLDRLGALAGATLTAAGRRMARLPMHPRLSRLVLEADQRGAGREGCAAAAWLSSGVRPAAAAEATGPSDVLSLLDSPAPHLVRRLTEQIVRLARPRNGGSETGLLQALLAAFPDRVVRRRQGRNLMLASGSPAELAASSCVSVQPLLVAVDVEDRPDRGVPLVRAASAIEPDWLLELFPECIEAIRRVEWDRAAERVEGVEALVYGAVAVVESRGLPDPDEAAPLLARKATEAGVARFADPDELAALQARIAFAARHSGMEPLPDTAVEDALTTLCRGLRSLSDLEAACAGGRLAAAILDALPPGARAQLDRAAPERLRLPSGRTARIRYAAHQPPWVASRLQDFFGLRETPRIGPAQVPLVLHLLAPNQRPVQTTTDLAGFWERLYPQVRRELGRRYPKHAWPEAPVHCD
ncbi:MAG: ATP-dependent helicase HrpB [Bryobacterales bacterium]|nr:ATP-dependent helicase HrpB [Bryobacterales bacterium]